MKKTYGLLFVLILAAGMPAARVTVGDAKMKIPTTDL